MRSEPSPIQPASPSEGHDHPTPWTYIVIAFILTVLTLLEIGVYYFPPSVTALVIILSGLAVAKFILVVGFYMHLKYDAKLFTWLLAGGLLIAIAMLTGLWALFNGWGG